MKQEPYLCLTIDAPDQLEEPLSDICWHHDCLGVMIDDPRVIVEHLKNHDWEASIFDDQEPQTGQIQLKSWFTDDREGRANIKKVREAIASLLPVLGINPLAVVITESVPPTVDWLGEFKKHFTSRKIGRIVIKPTWEEYQPQGDEVVLEIDPGMAFGSGDHATTAMCLAALDQYITPGTRVLDIGCGSAILAIAAALLGASEVLAIDNDPVAITVARENIAMNQVGQLVTPLVGNLACDVTGHYQLIMANIVADPIIALIPTIPELLNDEGLFLASGILAQRLDDVLAALTQSELTVVEQWQTDNWCAVAARKVG